MVVARVCCEKACSYTIHTYHIGNYRWITAARDPVCCEGQEGSRLHLLTAGAFYISEFEQLHMYDTCI